MDHSTGTSFTPAVAMKLVESDTATLTSSLADGAVRDLGHDELTERRRRPARAGPDRGRGAGRGRGGRRPRSATSATVPCRWVPGCGRPPGYTPADAAATARTARALRAGLLPATAAALGAGEISARHAQAIADGIHTTTSGGHRGPAPADAVALIEPEVLDVARQADTRSVAAADDRLRPCPGPRRRRRRRAAPPRTPRLDPVRHPGRHHRHLRARRRDLRLDPGRRDRRRHPARGRRHPHPRPDPPGRPGRDLPAVAGEPRRPHPRRRRTPPRHRHHRQRDPLSRRPPRPTRHHPRGQQGRVDQPRVSRRRAVRHRPHPGLHRPAPGLRRRAHHRPARPRRRRHRHPHRTPVLHLPPTARDDRTRRRPLPLAVVRPTGHLVRRAPPDLVHPRRPHHRRQRRPTLPAHHTQCHEGGWTLHRLPDGRYTATHRDGRTHGPEPHPPGRNRAPTSRPPPQRE